MGLVSLYQRGNFTWKSVGIKAQARSKKLSQNYRNTQEILQAAWSVVKPLQTEEPDSEEITFPIVEPLAALRKGQRPVLHLCDSRPMIVDDVIAQVSQLVSTGYNPKDIAILYRYKSQIDAPLFDRLIQQLDHLSFGCYWVTRTTDSRGNYSTHVEGVRLITALSSLGLELKAVLIPWVQQFGDRHSQETEAAALARRQLYVAMTRAQEQLHLFGSGDAPILDELR